MPPAFLRMELTESFLMGDSGRSTAVLDALANVGVGLSIDDFGTGYSSLSYLKRLPIEEIKIDRSFVMQMHVDANDFMIVRATVDLGRNLGSARRRRGRRGPGDVRPARASSAATRRRATTSPGRSPRSSSRAGCRSATSTARSRPSPTDRRASAAQHAPRDLT